MRTTWYRVKLTGMLGRGKKDGTVLVTADYNDAMREFRKLAGDGPAGEQVTLYIDDGPVRRWAVADPAHATAW